ncbi:MAG: alpha/beta hydrolase [Chryseolinea sp.]
MKRFVQHDGSSLHYEVVGTGNKPLLLFHGFGQDRSIFKNLVLPLSTHYTIYSFDLFFHGHSVWLQGDRPLEKSTWREFIIKFTTAEKLNEFSIAGFSLGARFALATFELFPAMTAKIFLLAPDGIHENVWYRVATQSYIARRFFKGMVYDYTRFVKVLEMLRKSGLVNEKLAQFAGHQMNSEFRRKRVYYSWVVFRKLKFNKKKLADLFNTQHTPVIIILGKYDHVIRPEDLEGFLNSLQTVRKEIVPTGHHGLIENSGRFFMDAGTGSEK